MIFPHLRRYALEENPELKKDKKKVCTPVVVHKRHKTKAV
jgi:hypothetical protein